ncbi:MAG: type II secretion system F family protein [Patescibacteria group bacterium]
MKFKYQARTKEGELQVGVVEAGSREAAANILAGHDLFVLSVESAEKPFWLEGIFSYFGRVKGKDMVVFVRQLATLLEARLPLNSALKTLYNQTGHTILREAVFQMAEDIDAGLSFSQAMERQGNVFPQFYIEMIKAAEITGNLNEIMGFLADYSEKESILMSKAKSAMVYPAIVIFLFLVVAFIMVSFVFPQIAPVFEQSDVQLPIYTRILLGSGTFLGKWWPALILGVFFLGVLALDWSRTPEGKSIIDDAKIKLPILNKIFLPVVMTRFSDATALLIHGGIPIAQALEVIGHMIGNVLYRDIFHDIAESVRRGETLSQSVAKYPDYFPPLVSQMMAVGERTGTIEQVMKRLAGFYSREADSVINNLVDLIQPVLMIGIGVLVAFMFASILIPLYSLTSTLR